MELMNQKSDGLANQTSQISLLGKIRGVHNKILATKEVKSEELELSELRLLIGKIIAMCGIKEIPSQEIASMCFESWNSNYSAWMNKHELALAFELNMTGNLEAEINGKLKSKVEHFQCFSVEYFCDVLNLYLKKKSDTNAKVKPIEKEETKPSADISNILMQELISDRETVIKGVISEKTPIASRLELLNQLFEVNISEDAIKSYRALASATILNQLNKAAFKAKCDQKFGRQIELANQIERIKQNKLMTEKDEALIQYEVSKLIYCNELLKWNETEFINHVESQMVK